MALYEDIRDDLLAKIKSGAYQEGERIPTEKELAEVYGVSRPTVRQALQILEKQGYLDRRRRRGTVVCHPKIHQHFTAGLRSFAADMHLEGNSTSTRVLTFESEPASSEVAGALAIDQGSPVWHLVRLRFVDGAPNVLVDTCVPCGVAPELDSFDFSHDSLYQRLEEQGQTVVSAHRSFEAMAADEDFASLLEVAPGDPLLYFHTVARSVTGATVEYSTAVYRGVGNVFELDVVKR